MPSNNAKECYAQFSAPIFNPNISISKVSGEGLAIPPDFAYVNEFKVIKGEVFYFPRDLKLFFNNINMIMVTSSGLKEIHQTDLSPFEKLRNLDLSNNALKVIEENLFEFNIRLESILLNNNKINFVHPNVFDDLRGLSYIGFQNNECYDSNSSGATNIKSEIEVLKEKCGEPEKNENRSELDRFEGN